MEIRDQNGKVLVDHKGSSLIEAVEAAVKRGVRLAGAKLSGADLSGATLAHAKLDGADLFGANLTRADLTNADLEGANLAGADLASANLTDAYLRDADVRDAKFDAMYEGLYKLCSVADVLKAIEQNLECFEMGVWHEGDWHNGKVHDDLCNTSHCMAGHAHIICARERPELLNDKVNVYLVGRLALGEEAASHFFNSNEDALKWLRKTVNEITTEKA